MSAIRSELGRKHIPEGGRDAEGSVGAALVWLEQHEPEVGKPGITGTGGSKCGFVSSSGSSGESSGCERLLCVPSWTPGPVIRRVQRC